MKNPFYTAIWRIVRPLTMLLHPIEVSGLENVPADEPVLFCVNHSSAWDPVLMVVTLNEQFNLRIMAKKQLFAIPVVGGFIRRMGAFPVDRGHSDIGAVKGSIRCLKDGFSLLIFPEGTRVKKGETVAPKGGAAMIAIRAGVKMLPVFIGMDKRLFHRVPMVFGKPYAPVYTERKGTAEDYQANAEEIMRQVYRLGGVQ